MTNINILADRSERLRERHAMTFGKNVCDSIVIIADPNHARTFSGQVTWAILLNLVARLYKGIRRIRIDIKGDIVRFPHVFFPNSEQDIRRASLQLLQDLQVDVQIDEGVPTNSQDEWIWVYVGEAPSGRQADTITVGGRGWVGSVNSDQWSTLSDTQNPIGPMVAACLGAAEIYKRLYGARENVQAAITLNAFDFSASPAVSPELPDPLSLPFTYVGGAGAIGMALLCMLDSIPRLHSAGLALVDDDTLDWTNLNRCIIAILRDHGIPKLELCSARLNSRVLDLRSYPEKWETFVQRDEQSAGRFERVVSCVDKYASRRALQYAKIPRVLLTAGTGDFLLSVSRHRLDDGLSCGLCYQARDPSRCATVSGGAKGAFEQEPEPSIGFVSVLAGVLLGAELLKEVVPNWQDAALRNTARVSALSGVAKLRNAPRDEACNCSSKYVALAYKRIWRREAHGERKE